MLNSISNCFIVKIKTTGPSSGEEEDYSVEIIKKPSKMTRDTAETYFSEQIEIPYKDDVRMTNILMLCL